MSLWRKRGASHIRRETMNREDIIRMARESHLDVYGLGNDREKFVSVVEHFANLVAAMEREACAKACESDDWNVAAAMVRARENT
jgi:hypothetical protein